MTEDILKDVHKQLNAINKNLTDTNSYLKLIVDCLSCLAIHQGASREFSKHIVESLTRIKKGE